MRRAWFIGLNSESDVYVNENRLASCIYLFCESREVDHDDDDDCDDKAYNTSAASAALAVAVVIVVMYLTVNLQSTGVRYPVRPRTSFG